MNKTRVAIIKKQALLRECLVLLLREQPDFDVIGHWGSSEEALPYIADNIADVIILDISEDRGGDMAGLPRLKRATSQTRIVVLTGHPNMNELKITFKLGASGYTSQNTPTDTFLEAIRKIQREGTYVAFEVKEQLVSSYLERVQMGELKVMMDLTPREQQVLRLLAQGYKAREAATQLGLSHKTVETYKYRLMTKLCLSNHADLVQYAAGKGWLKFEPPKSQDFMSGGESFSGEKSAPQFL